VAKDQETHDEARSAVPRDEQGDRPDRDRPDDRHEQLVGPWNGLLAQILESMLKVKLGFRAAFDAGGQ